MWHFSIKYTKPKRQGCMNYGKSSWFYAVFHRTWNGDRLACLRDHRTSDCSSFVYAVWLSFNFVNKMGMKRLSANPFIPIYFYVTILFIKIISVWEKLLWSLLKRPSAKCAPYFAGMIFNTLRKYLFGKQKNSPHKTVRAGVS